MTQRMNRRAGRHQARGVAALELAVWLPVLVMLLVAAWEWGRALEHHERLAHGVRAAARHLATGDAADPVRQDEARQLAVYGRLAGGGTPLVPGLNTSQVQIREPGSDPAVRLVSTGAGAVSLVTVTIAGVRHEPVLLPARLGFTLRPVSLTLVLRFS